MKDRGWMKGEGWINEEDFNSKWQVVLKGMKDFI